MRERRRRARRCASSASSATERGTRSASGTTARAPSKRSAPGRSSRSSPSRWRHVEEQRRERRRPAPAVRAAEPARGDLERLRPAVGPQRDRLAVEHDAVATGSASAASTTSGTPRGDVVERAREDARRRRRAVHLDARAVELPLDRGGRRSSPARPSTSARGRGEHRLQRPRRPRAGIAPAPARRRRARAAATAPRSPRSISARRTSACRHAGGLRDRVGHHARERALAQVAEQQRGQEALLGSVARAEQRRRSASRRARLRARRRDSAADPLERRVDLGDRQRRRRPRARGRLAQRRPADADLPLAQLARQERDGDRALVRRQPRRSSVGQPRDLREPRGAWRATAAEVVDEVASSTAPRYVTRCGVLWPCPTS